MSTDFSFLGHGVSMENLLSAAKRLKLRVAKQEKDSLCLTDDEGSCYLWFYSNDDGMFYSATRYGLNYDAEERILAPLMAELQVHYASEYDDEYQEYYRGEDEIEEEDDSDGSKENN